MNLNFERVAGPYQGAMGGLAWDGARMLFSTVDEGFIHGFDPATLEILCEGPPSPGLSDEIVTVYLARGLTREGKGGGVGAEDIRVYEVPFAGAYAWLDARRAEGRLVDPVEQDERAAHVVLDDHRNRQCAVHVPSQHRVDVQ